MALDQGVGSGSQTCGSYGDRPWFCLRAKPNQEPIAVSELRNQGFPVCWPLKASGRGVEGLFPGYLFAQPLDQGYWSPMRSTRGVASIMMWGLTPAPVPPEAMDAIFSRLSEDHILWPQPSRQVNEGMRFRVEAGHPFSELLHACTRTANDRVFALLNIMGRKQEVGFPRHLVTPDSEWMTQ